MLTCKAVYNQLRLTTLNNIFAHVLYQPTYEIKVYTNMRSENESYVSF